MKIITLNGTFNGSEVYILSVKLLRRVLYTRLVFGGM